MPHKRHKNPSRLIHNRKANPKRAEKRFEAKMIFLRKIMKEREIGIDPKFMHGLKNAPSRDQWLKLSREYDERVAAA